MELILVLHDWHSGTYELLLYINICKLSKMITNTFCFLVLIELSYRKYHGGLIRIKVKFLEKISLHKAF